MINTKFVQICEVDGFLTALDENGRVWEWFPQKSDKPSFWKLLPDTRDYGEEQPAPTPNRYEDGRLWLGGNEVEYCGDLYEWRDTHFTADDLANFMIQPEFGNYSWDSAQWTLNELRKLNNTPAAPAAYAG